MSGVCSFCSPPVPVGVDSQGRAIPGEVPRLFGGEIVKYISVSQDCILFRMAGTDIVGALIVSVGYRL